MIIYTDGGWKPSTGAYGSFRIEEDDETLCFIGRIPYFDYPVKTNNEAEYATLIKALEYVKTLESMPASISLFSDSQLMLSQISGSYEVRAKNLKSFQKKAIALLEEFEDIILVYVPRACIVKKLGH